jgi:PAS domain S-box-containing protein
VQDQDHYYLTEKDLKVVTKRQPKEDEIRDLLYHFYLVRLVMDVLLRLKKWQILVTAVLLSELLTSVMSLILNGRITHEFLLTGGVVSLIVGSIVIMVVAQSQKLIFERDVLQEKVRERTREFEEANASLLDENTKRRLAEKRIVALIDALPDLIYFKDTDSRNLVVNHAFEKLIGLKKEEIEGKTDKELLPPVLAEHCRKQDEEVIRTCELLRVEEEHDLHGVTLFQETTKIPLLDERGVVTSLVGITRDITEHKLAEIQLKKSEQKFRSLFESATDGIFILDIEGNFIDVNTTAHTRLGYSKEEMLALHISQLDSPEFATRVPERLEDIQKKGIAVFESAHVRKDGTVMPVEVSSRLMEHEGRQVYFSHIRDITERKMAERQLRQSEERFRKSFESMGVGASMADLKGRFTEVNSSLCEMLGYKEEELLSRTFSEVSHPDDVQIGMDAAKQLIEGEITHTVFEKRYVRKDGELINVVISPTIIRDCDGNALHFMALFQDITERKRAEDDLLTSLEEKGILLKEVHHRVKNNMQVISSLLQLQSNRLADESVRSLFRESQDRIRSMAFVHEELYRSRDMSKVNMEEYVKNLSQSLCRSYGVSSDQIALGIAVEDMAMGIDTAIPCGLILNELISNALKHAFPDEAGGEVEVSLSRADEGVIVLDVSDNGVGLPPGFNIRESDTMGMSLVTTLAEMQLGGGIKVYQQQGTRFNIRFREQS